MRLVVLALIAILIAQSSACGDEPAKSRDDEAKKIAENFSRIITVEKNYKKALGFVHLPFVKIELKPKEDKDAWLIAVLIKDRLEWEKRITKDLDIRDDQTGVITDKILTRKELRSEKDFDGKTQSVIDQVMNDSDRLVSVSVKSGAFGMSVLVLVAWIEGNPKVVGCGYFYAR